jgi:hypothetical protein
MPFEVVDETADWIGVSCLESRHRIHSASPDIAANLSLGFAQITIIPNEASPQTDELYSVGRATSRIIRELAPAEQGTGNRFRHWTAKR